MVGSSSPCPVRRGRCGRCGTTRPSPASRHGQRGHGRRRRARTGSRASASRRWPSGRRKLLRGGEPEVATYARVEAVDVRVRPSAGPVDAAVDVVEAAATIVREKLGAFVWATGETTWAEAIGRDSRRAAGTWPSRIGTGGQVGALFGDVEWLRRDDVRSDDDLGDEDTQSATLGLLDLARPSATRRRRSGWRSPSSRPAGTRTWRWPLRSPEHELVEHRTAFLGGRMGRSRAALTTAALLFAALPAADQAAGWPAQRRALATRPGRSVMTNPVALLADQAVIGELAEQLVHALPRAADRRRHVHR